MGGGAKFLVKALLEKLKRRNIEGAKTGPRLHLLQKMEGLQLPVTLTPQPLKSEILNLPELRCKASQNISATSFRTHIDHADTTKDTVSDE